MAICGKCKEDVHPALVMATRQMGEGSCPNGFYKQCPRCQSFMPEEVAAETVTASRAPVRTQFPEPTTTPTPRANVSASPRPSMIDLARAELAQADIDIVQLQASIAHAKTEIALKKAHRAGLLKVVSAYERAAKLAGDAARVHSGEPLAN